VAERTNIAEYLIGQSIKKAKNSPVAPAYTTQPAINVAGQPMPTVSHIAAKYEIMYNVGTRQAIRYSRFPASGVRNKRTTISETSPVTRTARANQ